MRFVTLYNGAFAMGEGALTWDGHRRIESDYNRHGPILDQPAAPAVADLKARGLLDDTLDCLDHRVRSHADLSKGNLRTRSQPERLHSVASRCRREAWLSLSGRPTSSAIRPFKTWSTSTTFTPRFSTYSDSITNGSHLITTAPLPPAHRRPWESNSGSVGLIHESAPSLTRERSGALSVANDGGATEWDFVTLVAWWNLYGLPVVLVVSLPAPLHLAAGLVHRGVSGKTVRGRSAVSG